MQVDFYHLAAAPLDAVLPRICERLIADGQRLLVVADDEPLLARLDRRLWDYAPPSFLPHGREGGDDDTRQPILLSAGIVAANGARNVALVDGRWRDAALHFDRAFYLFDAERLDEARFSWRTLASRDDVTRKFWKQDEGGKWREGP